MAAVEPDALTAPRVLVVEDEPAICELIGEMLSPEGYEVVCATSDREAYELLSGPAGFAALLVDVNLGSGTTGFDVARFARNADSRMAVLYVSGQASDVSFAMFGVPRSELVTKPFTAAELVGRVKQLVEGAG